MMVMMTTTMMLMMIFDCVQPGLHWQCGKAVVADLSVNDAVITLVCSVMC